MVNQALAYLQFFDVLSLWFCGAERGEPQAFAVPEGYEVTIVPTGQLRFTLRPGRCRWDIFNGRYMLRRIPAARYASREALAATPSQPGNCCSS